MAEPVDWKDAKITANDLSLWSGDYSHEGNLARAFRELDALVGEMVPVIENMSGIDHEIEVLIARAKEVRGE